MFRQIIMSKINLKKKNSLHNISLRACGTYHYLFDGIFDFIKEDAMIISVF